jgi:hypothetical protein
MEAMSCRRSTHTHSRRSIRNRRRIRTEGVCAPSVDVHAEHAISDLRCADGTDYVLVL